MRKLITTTILILFTLTIVMGCALGRKEWPKATKSEDTFNLELLEGVRQDNCLLLDVNVTGAANRLWRASIQYEAVGDLDGQGCFGCPFVPRDAVHFTRDQNDFNIQGNNLKLSICSIDPDTEYRFRVAGKSELPTMPIVYTEVYVTSP